MMDSMLDNSGIAYERARLAAQERQVATNTVSSSNSSVEVLSQPPQRLANDDSPGTDENAPVLKASPPSPVNATAVIAPPQPAATDANSSLNPEKVQRVPLTALPLPRRPTFNHNEAHGHTTAPSERKVEAPAKRQKQCAHVTRRLLTQDPRVKPVRPAPVEPQPPIQPHTAPSRSAAARSAWACTRPPSSTSARSFLPRNRYSQPLARPTKACLSTKLAACRTNTSSASYRSKLAATPAPEGFPPSSSPTPFPASRTRLRT